MPLVAEHEERIRLPESSFAIVFLAFWVFSPRYKVLVGVD